MKVELIMGQSQEQSAKNTPVHIVNRGHHNMKRHLVIFVIGLVLIGGYWYFFVNDTFEFTSTTIPITVSNVNQLTEIARLDEDKVETVYDLEIAGDVLTTISYHGDIGIINLDSGREIERLDCEDVAKCESWEWLTDVAISNDGRMVATGSYQEFSNGGQLRLWSAETGDLVSTIVDNEQIFAVDINYDQTLVASIRGFGERNLFVTDIDSRQNLNVFFGIDRVSAIAFSPDEALLAVGQATGLSVWDTDTGSETVLSTKSIEAVGFSSDGEWVGGWNATHIYLFHLKSGQSVEIPDGAPHSGVVFSSDSRLIASRKSGVQQNHIRIWEIETGDIVHELNVAADWIAALAFSPDGTLLATSEAGNVIRFWDVGHGVEVHSMTVESPFRDGIFSENGTMFVSISDSGFQVWGIRE